MIKGFKGMLKIQYKKIEIYAKVTCLIVFSIKIYIRKRRKNYCSIQNVFSFIYRTIFYKNLSWLNSLYN